MIYNALCALAVGDALGMNAFELERGINSYVSASGRMNIYEKNGYTVIADAYNASPTAMRSAIDVLKLAEGRKVAILGDMFELGENEAELHRQTGEYAKNAGIDLVICVGGLSKDTFEGAKGTDIAGCFDANGNGAIVNASRSILCAWKKREGMAFDAAARDEALRMKQDLWDSLAAVGKAIK